MAANVIRTRLCQLFVSCYTFREGDSMATLTDIVRQLREEQVRLTRQLHAIGAALTAFGATYTNDGGTKKPLSAAGRARIAAAQRARWAKIKANGEQKKVVTMPKRTMSAAARRKIAAAQRARWAKVRAKKKA
jgi:hypothetical protein